MAQGRLDYEQMCADALRGVVRRALKVVEHRGLPAGHHFLITFKTGHPGVEMPDYLRERYPDSISIMLQYEFWNLEVEDERFAVTLSFSDVHERLGVPFGAVTGFVDPFAKFQLKFEPQLPEAVAAAPKREKPTHLKPVESKPAKADDKAKGADVVTLDAFRKK
jgi:hypothetical protein